MNRESEFAASLARALGPLYRVSVVTGSGQVVATFGRIEGSRGTRAEIPIPHSVFSLTLELDVEALDRADEVLHTLAAPHQLREGPLSALVHLDRALDHLIAQGEANVGKPVGDMTRLEKQQLVRFLDERGAFSIRRAVEIVAQILGVSRFTVYNYLESAREQAVPPHRR